MAGIKRTLVALVAAGVATLAAAAPANAGLLVASAQDCDAQASSQVFLRWLDPMRYVPAPGGDAESAAGWKLEDGARVVGGNEPWKVGGSGDDSSLLLPRGSQATTGVMCVGIEHPTLRLFARHDGVLTGALRVDVIFADALGFRHSLTIARVLAGDSWSPTLPMPVVANLLALLPGERTRIAFRFVAEGSGAWQIDDVYVDPYVRH
jgi:hypothetical protein